MAEPRKYAHVHAKHNGWRGQVCHQGSKHHTPTVADRDEAAHDVDKLVYVCRGPKGSAGPNGTLTDADRAELDSLALPDLLAHFKGKSQSIIRGTSKYRGVCWNMQASKWQAQMQIGRNLRLGLFNDNAEEEAARAFDAAAILRGSEVALLNFPSDWAALDEAQAVMQAEARLGPDVVAKLRQALAGPSGGKQKAPRTYGRGVAIGRGTAGYSSGSEDMAASDDVACANANDEATDETQGDRSGADASEEDQDIRDDDGEVPEWEQPDDWYWNAVEAARKFEAPRPSCVDSQLVDRLTSILHGPYLEGLTAALQQHLEPGSDTGPTTAASCAAAGHGRSPVRRHTDGSASDDESGDSDDLEAFEALLRDVLAEPPTCDPSSSPEPMLDSPTARPSTRTSTLAQLVAQDEMDAELRAYAASVLSGAAPGLDPLAFQTKEYNDKDMIVFHALLVVVARVCAGERLPPGLFDWLKDRPLDRYGPNLRPEGNADPDDHPSHRLYRLSKLRVPLPDKGLARAAAAGRAPTIQLKGPAASRLPPKTFNELVTDGMDMRMARQHWAAKRDEMRVLEASGRGVAACTYLPTLPGTCAAAAHAVTGMAAYPGLCIGVPVPPAPAALDDPSYKASSSTALMYEAVRCAVAAAEREATDVPELAGAHPAFDVTSWLAFLACYVQLWLGRADALYEELATPPHVTRARQAAHIEALQQAVAKEDALTETLLAHGLLPADMASSVDAACTKRARLGSPSAGGSSHAPGPRPGAAAGPPSEMHVFGVTRVQMSEAELAAWLAEVQASRQPDDALVFDLGSLDFS